MITENSKKGKEKNRLVRYTPLYFKLYGGFHVTQTMLYSYTLLFQVFEICDPLAKWPKLQMLITFFMINIF